MQEIKAIIQPFTLSAVLEGLRHLQALPALTVSQVEGFSVVHPEFEPLTRTKLEIMVPDELVEPVVQVIQKHAHTGNPGDGRIFVLPIRETINIRTGERGNAT